MHAAIAANEAERFKQRYGRVDVLLLDDMQFLTGRRETQTELLRLLNALQGTGRQVVMTSDRPPAEIPDVDERLITDVIDWGAARGARSLSLAFAPFPELFELHRRNAAQLAAYRAVHLLDRFIRLESLYRFVRKFHALGTRRYAALRPWQVVWVAIAALNLEFGRGRSSE